MNQSLILKKESKALFQKELMLLNLKYGFSVLCYILSRQEVEIKAEHTLYYLSKSDDIKSEQIYEYYEHFSNLIKAIQRYVFLEESTKKSGAYEPDRRQALSSVLLLITHFEDKQQADFRLLLSSMIKDS